MTRCSLLIDECLPRSIDRGLARRIGDFSILRVGQEDAPPVGTADGELLRFCQAEQRLLVTADRSTMLDEITQFINAGGQTWGVLIVRPRSSVGQVLDELELVMGGTDAEEWIDCCAYIPF